jgi:glycosyltransferase involved in cell wall biosynthesis
VGAVSESEARFAREMGARDVRVISNGIPELDEPPQAPARRPERPLVCASGRMALQRRPDACARILAAVKDLADVAWIGGGRDDDDYARSSRAMLEDAGVPLSGWLPRDEALRRLGEATTYLHWTSADGQPLSVLEALARDVVVVASDIPPNRDILGAAQVREREEDAIALIRDVLTDAGRAEELLRSQRERASRYGARAMATAWLALHRELAASRTR